MCKYIGLFCASILPPQSGMAAYSKLQQAEFASEIYGYTATRHQREVGTGYFDEVSQIISGGTSSTTAMKNSTEADQEPDCCIALPTAQIAVMGPEAAVNAVYAKKISELDEGDRAAFIEEKRREYKENIDVYRLASELVIDGIVHGNELRNELIDLMM